MVGTYNGALVFLSLVIASLASYVALELAVRVTESRGKAAKLWLVAGAVAMGIGIWSMHFIGMLAFKLPIALAYDIPITLLSLVIAVAVSGFALWAASRARITWRNLIGGGVLMGLGISTMHYTGMAALTVVPGIEYDPLIFALSILVSIAAAIAALWIAFQLRKIAHSRALLRKFASALVMGLAITGMHYTGMYAAHFGAQTICISGQGFDSVMMSALVAGASGLILGVTLLVAVLDTRMQRRAAVLEEDKSELERLAMRDPLTQLLNRRPLEDRINVAIRGAAAARFAIIFIDLDRFKLVNDSFGHHVGDRLLQVVASSLARCTRTTDTIARIGGDEFVVMLACEGDDTQSVVALVERIQLGISTPVIIEENAIHITSSIGIAMYPAHGSDAHALIVNADAAMYRVKKQGRNHYQVFIGEAQSESKDRLNIENALREALEHDEFAVHYQAMYEITTGHIVGAEALVRWQHPTRGYLSPDEFIPIAEDLGLIGQLGQWVLETACRQAREWQQKGLPPFRLAVNVSAHQIGRGDFDRMVSGCLQRTGFGGRHLELEITERTLLYNVASVSQTLFNLHALGVKVAIDDFGVGYSSLQYLRRLPIDKLKIDRSFIADVDHDADDEAIVRAVISIGHSLRMMVVAEGVETVSQLAKLRELGCDYYQGYLSGKPLPASAFETVLANSHAMSALDLADDSRPASPAH